MKAQSGSANPLLKYYLSTFLEEHRLFGMSERFSYDFAHHNSGLAVLNQELMTPWLKTNERRLKRVRGKWDFLI